MKMDWLVEFDRNQGVNTWQRIGHGTVVSSEPPEMVARGILARVAHNRRRTFDRGELQVTLTGDNGRTLFRGCWDDLPTRRKEET